MKNFNVSKDVIGAIVKGAGNVLAFASVFVLPYLSKKDVGELARPNSKAGYDDAIGAIMKSDMLSSDKAKAATIVPKVGGSDLYKAVIQVINSDMLSSDRIEVIERICSE